MISFRPQVATLSLVAFAIAVVVVLEISSKAILVNTLASDVRSEGAFFITPESVEMNLSDSYTFSSYEQVGTKSVATKADWSIVRELEDGTFEEDPNDLYLENCTDSATCTVHLSDVSGALTLTAQSDDQSAEAEISVVEALPESPYTDEIPEWAEASVYLLNDRGIMMGYSNGEFGSEDPVTRAQFVTLYYRILDLAYPEVPDIVSDCDVYSDVDSTHFGYEAICFGYYGNWYEGMEEVSGTFNPDQALTRLEAAQILANSFLEGMFNNYYAPLFGLDIGLLDFATALYYIDLEDYQISTVEPIGLVSYFELMTGSYQYSEEWHEYGWHFFPENPINRAETAVILTRFIKDLDLE